MCPECGSSSVAIKPYDFGICTETGYRDAGEQFHCRECGARGDVDDLHTPPTEFRASFPFAAGIALVSDDASQRYEATQ